MQILTLAVAIVCAVSGCSRVNDETKSEQPLPSVAANSSLSADAVRQTEEPKKAAPPAAQDSSEYCTANTEEWVSGCSASCTASWEGSDCPSSCTASPPPGYVLVDYRENNISENNGGHSVSWIPSDSKFDFKSSIESAYNSAIDLAGKYGNDSAAINLKDEMKRSLTVAQSFASSHQMLRLEVNASKHGNVFDRKRGWSEQRVEMKIRCVVPPDLQRKLYEKYGLK
jgi:hypothetical protein